MKKILFLVFGLAILSSVSADTVALDCDTLFTKDGKMYLIKYFGTTNAKVEYTLCDDDSGQHYTLPKARIIRVAIHPNNQKAVTRQRDPLERLARNAYIYSLVGAVSIGILSVFAYTFMIIGMVKGEKALRMLKKAGSHPSEKKIRRQSRTAIIIGMASLIGMVSLYLLILLVL
jgi:hypothetical protein